MKRYMQNIGLSLSLGYIQGEAYFSVNAGGGGDGLAKQR
jgi:hypothetical protein